MKRVRYLILLLLIIAIVPLADSKVITSEFTATEIVYSPSPAQPGQYAHITAIIQNTQLGDAENIEFVLEPEYPFSLEPGENGIIKFDKICKNCRRTIEYDVLVAEDAKVGTYEFNLKACSESKETCIIIPIQMYVNPGGQPDMKVVVEEIKALPNEKALSVTVNIINRGELGIKYLVASLSESESYDVIYPKEIYVGSLTSDDFDTVEYKIIPKAKGKITLPIQLEYSDINNKEYDMIHSISIPSKLPNGKSFSWGAFVLGIIITVLAYMAFKKRKKLLGKLIKR